MGSLDGWLVVPEASFSIYGERGVVGLLAFHRQSGALLVIELKTVIVDVNELVGTLDRMWRLAPQIAAQEGWRVRSVSRCVIVSRTPPNARRPRVHRAVLRAAFPADGRAVRSWLIDPGDAISALSTRPSTNGGSAVSTAIQRVAVRTPPRLPT